MNNPTSYSLRRAAIRALDHGDFQQAAELIILSKEEAINEQKQKVESLRLSYSAFFEPKQEVVNQFKKTYEQAKNTTLPDGN